MFKLRRQIRDFKNYLKNREYIWKFKLFICLPIFIVMLIIDFASKFTAFKLLNIGGKSVNLIHNFLAFNRVNNSGIAFGYNDNATALPGTIAIAVLIAIFILLLFLFINNKKLAVVLIIMFAGASGNLLDRMWHNGKVIDFIQMGPFASPWYICNLADIYIILGACSLFIIILIDTIQSYVKEKKLEKIEEEENIKKVNVNQNGKE